MWVSIAYTGKQKPTTISVWFCFAAPAYATLRMNATTVGANIDNDITTVYTVHSALLKLHYLA